MKQTWLDCLHVDVGELEGFPIVRLSGEGEGRGAAMLEQVLEGMLERGDTRLILDTRDVRFLNPSCSDLLVAWTERLAEEGGMLLVVDNSLPVERTLKLLGLAQVASVLPTLSQAVTYLNERS